MPQWYADLLLSEQKLYEPLTYTKTHRLALFESEPIACHLLVIFVW